MRRSMIPLASRLAGAAAVLAMTASMAVAAPADPSGLWFTKGDLSIIRIGPCGAHLCGKLVWLKEPKNADGSPKLDRNNKDSAKQTRPMLGLDLLTDFAAEDDHWVGHAYNPEDGRTYDITFKVDDPKGKPVGDTAEIRGCVLRYLCKSETFKRANEIPKTQAMH